MKKIYILATFVTFTRQEHVCECYENGKYIDDRWWDTICMPPYSYTQ